MVKVDLLWIEISNFMSFGNTVTRIEFTDGMNWVKGVNGYGKSAIIEAINYLFFGKSYRDLEKKDSLINTANGKALFIRGCCKRTTPTTCDTYIIERGMKAAKFSIIKNGQLVSEEGKGGVYQMYLENSVLGFNEVLFRNVIAMSSSFSKPFLEMTLPEKRKFLESILGVGDIEKIKIEFKKELSTNKSKLDVATSILPIEVRKLSELNELLDNALSEKVGSIQDLVDQLNEYNAELANIVSVIENLKNDRSIIVLKGTELSDKFSIYKNVEVDYTSNIAKRDLLHKSIESDTVRLNNYISESDKYIVDTSMIDSLSSQVSELQDKIKSYGDVKVQLGRCEGDISSTEKIIENLYSRYKTIKAGVPCDRCSKPSTEADVAPIKESIIREGTDAKDRLATLKTEHLRLTSIDLLYSTDVSLLDEAKNNLNALKLVEHKKLESLKSIESTRKLIDFNKNELSTVIDSIDVLSGKLEIAKEMRTELEDLRIQRTDINGLITLKESVVSDIKTKISKLSIVIESKKNNTSDDLISKTRINIDNCSNTIDACKSDISKLSHDIELLNYVITVFGDEGIKEYMMRKYIPVLNNSISKILSEFDIPFRIAFDKNLEFEFINNFGNANEYKGLSGGQRGRLHFSIYMAFREFVNKIGKFNINMLFLDEILDDKMDEGGLFDMISIIRSNVKDIGSVYLISHNPNLSHDLFDSTLELSYDGTFSSIEVIQ